MGRRIPADGRIITAVLLLTAFLAGADKAAAQETGVDYMRQVHQEYRKLYGTAMPLDVYVIHGYISPETSVPTLRNALYQHRLLMREQGLQHIPLWIKEFGPLGVSSIPEIETYMRGSVACLRSAADLNVGPAWDGGKFVQRWAWFVMQDGEAQFEGAWDNVALFDADSRARKRLGDVYAELANRALIEDYPDPASRPSVHYRFGIGSSLNAPHTAISNYDYRSLKISWFFDWSSAGQNAPGLGYMPLVAGWGPGAPSADTVRSIGASHPSGTVWTVGNEIGWDDRRSPRRYAQDYHDTYQAIHTAASQLGKTFYVATGATMPGLRIYKAPSRYANPDGVPDLFAIRKKMAGSPKTCVQVLGSQDWLSKVWWDAGTVLHPTGSNFEFGAGDWNRDGHPDILAFKKSQTGQGRTEVHVLNGANGYASFAGNIVTALHETGPEASLHAADWNRDRVPDLWYVKKFWTGSNRTEIHILDGAGWFQRFTCNVATALHDTGNEADFCVADWNRDGVPDLWYIKKFWTGSNRTEVHILDGASWFQRFTCNVATALHTTGDEAEFVVSDWNRDGVPDLWYVKKYGTGSGNTEVHILDGANWFQRFSAHIGTGLEATGADDAFLVNP